jgi:hypothetical protein
VLITTLLSRTSPIVLPARPGPGGPGRQVGEVAEAGSATDHCVRKNYLSLVNVLNKPLN